MGAGLCDAMVSFHRWITGEVGLRWEPESSRWVHEGLGVEVRASVAEALVSQGRASELRAGVVTAIQRKAEIEGARFGVPGVEDPFPGRAPSPRAGAGAGSRPPER